MDKNKIFGNSNECLDNKNGRIVDDDKSLQLINIEFLKDKIFYIPDYQRGYRWTDEVEYFVKDIVDCTNDEYLFQPIVVKEKGICNFNYKQQLNEYGKPKEVSGDINSPSYELIDGQQRLTTLYLVLAVLKEPPKFKIYYQSKREIDNIYMENAIGKLEETIKSLKSKEDFKNDLLNKARFIWYETENSAKETFKSLNAGKTELTSAELFKALLLNESDSKELRQLIAYQFDEMETQLNDEKLWCFLSDDGTVSTRIDFILNIYMLSLSKKIIYNEKGKEYKSTCNIEKYKSKAKDLLKRIDYRFAFLAYSNFLEAVKDNNVSAFDFYEKYNGYKAKDYWEEIYDCFEIIKSWYSNPILHNLIGFLLAKKGDSYKGKLEIISDLIDKQRDNDYNNFVKEIYKIILEEFKFNDSDNISNYNVEYGIGRVNLKKGLKGKKHYLYLAPTEEEADKDDLSYGSGKKCYNFLLFSNIEKANKSRIMFDFRHLKSKYNVTKENLIVWDIEHINPKNIEKTLLDEELGKFKLAKKFDDDEKVKEIIKSSIEFVLDNCNIDDENKKLLKDFCDNILVDYARIDEVRRCWKGLSYIADNSITNLTLLSSDINRSYHDDPFKLKKQQIIEYSDKGYFIPLITRQIFTSTKYSEEIKWDDDAKQKYRDDLIMLVKETIEKSGV